VFRGEFDNEEDIINGEWADVPIGRDMSYGKLDLKLKMHP
jgi:hypothetical protein